MDTVEETPAKRRRTQNGFLTVHSQDDLWRTEGADFSIQIAQEIPDSIPIEDDEIEEYETIPTLPLDAPIPGTPLANAAQDEESDTLRTIPFTVQETPRHKQSTQHQQSSSVTQPTQRIGQVLRSSSPDAPQPIIQVMASSPAASSPKHSSRPVPGALGNRMAPPGTQFRPPVSYRPAPARTMPIKKPEPILVSSDDEEPLYVKDSDEDEEYNRDIKPTLIKSKKSPTAFGSTQTSFGNSFLEGFRHNSLQSPSPNASFSATNRNSQTGDSMANAYGRTSRPPRPPQKQKAPSKARADAPNMALDDIPDFMIRKRVQQMREILVNQSVAACYEALVMKRFNEEDAMDYLASKDDPPQEALASFSDDELASQPETKPRKSTAKQQVQKKQTIQEKYTARTSAKHSQYDDGKMLETPAKPRRRLERGRKFHSPASVSATAPNKAIILSDSADLSIDSDSEAPSDPEVDSAGSGKLLSFLNSCTVKGLIDLAQTTQEKAELILSMRPFKNLEQIREITQEAPQKVSARRKPKQLVIGEKILEDCERMWNGFEAVDELVRRCEEIGKPIANAMQRWGVNAYGNSDKGELEIVNMDNLKCDTSNKDSGLGSSPQSNPSGDENDILSPSKRNQGTFFPQPMSLAEGVELKDYQVIGINWLSLLFKSRMSCILADDMGLGKTCQVISFLAHLRENNIQGPHIIMVPSSVLENWLREFESFCPDIHVMPYHASKLERDALMEQILEEKPEVIITTYTIAKKKEDRKFFKSIKPVCCIFDEGHMLKNPKSEVYRQLLRIPCEFRLLLTGTPLQNNLGELIALLGFMIPSVFEEHQEDLQAVFGLKATTNESNNQHAALLSVQRIARAKSMMTPFILRRKKHQVLKDIPAKNRNVRYCEMTSNQAALYRELTDLYREVVRRRNAGEKINMNDDTNPMMKMRKAAIHPLLFRRHFTDQMLREISEACRAESEFAESVPQYIYEDLEYASDMEMQRWCAKYKSVQRFVLQGEQWMDSGKVKALVDLLEKYRKNGDRVLVFSQFVMVLDILEEVMETISMKFARLDGSLDINLRQDLIDKFYKDESITVFMLSTKAGGAGINLACANKVVIFDSSFNPQDDVQAENRAHRVGQTREVEVVRLITRNTIEEQIHALGQAKLALDELVAGDAADEAAATKAEGNNKKEVEQMLADSLSKEKPA